VNSEWSDIVVTGPAHHIVSIDDAPDVPDAVFLFRADVALRRLAMFTVWRASERHRNFRYHIRSR
jgi:hypothetical protein